MVAGYPTPRHREACQLHDVVVMARTLVGVAVAVFVLAACTGDTSDNLAAASSPSKGMQPSQAEIVATADEVVFLVAAPFPEGPPPPMFVLHPDPDAPRVELDLALVRDAIPIDLPTPSAGSCGYGATLTFGLRDGRELAYGTCDYPAAFGPLADAIHAGYRTMDPT